ncbi:unextended protein-like isoform X1 [Amphibalanus amphitrite]|uniref:unextended protein-like isoform X1 n=2 Tax=Amphibalanus amphitrite TaxID=1232801 RepID=UPI001C9070AA|nr:unextended protein-like isoform X1 [Amphibalanus amphitrite]XP_043202887.1 unextended protein-like isoform X1 [Amphibalanus amphitrite]
MLLPAPELSGSVTVMALTGQVCSRAVTGAIGIGLLRGFLYFVVVGSACGRVLSDESLSEAVFGARDEQVREVEHHQLGTDDLDLGPDIDIRLFAEEFAAPKFRQLALTESVKNKGEICSVSELQSVPVRTHGVFGNASSGDVRNGQGMVVGRSGCTTSYHLCAWEADSEKGHLDWIHLGKHSVIDIGHLCSSDDLDSSRRRRQVETAAAGAGTGPELTAAGPDPAAAAAGPVLAGLRVEVSYKPPDMGSDGVISVLQDREATLRLFGAGLADGLRFKFTGDALEPGASCEQSQTTVAFELKSVDAAGTSGLLTVVLPQLPSGAERFYVCGQPAGGGPYTHLGSQPYLAIGTFPPLLPLALHVVLLVVLLCLSGLFSGLNLGLMALNITELKLVLSTGTDSEKGWARTIIPVRNHGNYLLCTLLLGNVLVNSSLTILLDELTSGIVAVIGSTLGIVIFGEIVPQALCSRHGLAVGAKTIYLTKLFMIVTSPLSYPISLILDRVLGEEIGNTYNRDRLKELIKLNKDDMGLENEEQNMIVGALDLKAKTVADVMTPLEDVYMLPYVAILDYQTISEIMEQGYSRIPVYEGDRSNIVAVMLAKDMAFVDPDDCTPIKTLCHFYQNPWSFVFEDVTLDVMLREFKEGNKGHMAFVQRVVTETVGDPYYELVGLVTLEDVIEEMIQSEIVDETDVLIDNKTKKRRGKKRRMPDPIAFAQPTNNQIHISPQLALATFQFLQTVEPFKNEFICPSVLKKMLERDVVRHIKPRDDANVYIYERNKPVDFFCMILEGRVHVTMGKENLAFESGPFSYFGTQALVMLPSECEASPQLLRGSAHSLDGGMRASFTPEYCVRAITEVYYLKVRRSHYVAARKATLVAAQRDPSRSVDHSESLAHDMAALGSRTDSLRDFHLNPNNTVSRNGGDSSATLVSMPDGAPAQSAGGGGGGGGSDTEQSEMSSLLSVPATPSGPTAPARHVNFVEAGLSGSDPIVRPGGRRHRVGFQLSPPADPGRPRTRASPDFGRPPSPHIATL